MWACICGWVAVGEEGDGGGGGGGTCILYVCLGTYLSGFFFSFNLFGI